MSDPAHRHIAVVVPCYNEAERLDSARFERFAAEHPDVRFVLVNDGSRDATGQRLAQLRAAAPEAFDVVELAQNQGKAEAVRNGMLRAIELGADLAGYWDADLATPLEEIPRFAAVLAQMPQPLVVFGARVRLLGRSIERRAVRHYLGRLFATVASMILRLPIYDTQCGAKLFRVTPLTRALFAQRFAVGWTFDVELIARMIRIRRQLGQDSVAKLIYELPLESWLDVKGSKVKATDFVRALLEMLTIHQRYLRRGAPPLPFDAALQDERVAM
jgi:glycosyltransferase involved in cell wall biosynthesis